MGTDSGVDVETAMGWGGEVGEDCVSERHDSKNDFLRAEVSKGQSLTFSSSLGGETLTNRILCNFEIPQMTTGATSLFNGTQQNRAGRRQ